MHPVGKTLTISRGACDLIEVAVHRYTDKSYNYMMLSIHQNVTRQKWLIIEWESQVLHMLWVQKSEVTVGGGDLRWWWGSWDSHMLKCIFMAESKHGLKKARMLKSKQAQ